MVPTSRTWGHRHQRARLRPGFFYRPAQPGRAISSLITGVSQLRTQIIEMSADAAGMLKSIQVPGNHMSALPVALDAFRKTVTK